MSSSQISSSSSDAAAQSDPIGSMLDVGWGAEHGYPALALRSDGPEVAGFLFTTPALAAHWSALDEFEGPGYTRVLAQARREDGELVETWVYVDRAVGP